MVCPSSLGHVRLTYLAGCSVCLCVCAIPHPQSSISKQMRNELASLGITHIQDPEEVRTVMMRQEEKQREEEEEEEAGMDDAWNGPCDAEWPL